MVGSCGHGDTTLGSTAKRLSASQELYHTERVSQTMHILQTVTWCDKEVVVDYFKTS
jgi:hypothetical protein